MTKTLAAVVLTFIGVPLIFGLAMCVLGAVLHGAAFVVQ